MAIACCLIVKNESRVILEWIAYHHLLGFDGFIIIDHNSTDGTAEAALRAEHFTKVHVIKEPRLQPNVQDLAYAEAVQAFKDEYDWIAFIDADEYIASENFDDIHRLLDGVEAPAIALPWLIYGSNGRQWRGDDLIIEEFTRRSKGDFAPNRHVKSIVRPKAALSCYNPHAFRTEGDYVTAEKQKVEWGEVIGLLAKPAEAFEWRVNHYFTRSRTDWAERLKRGSLGHVVRSWQDFDSYDRNEVEDFSAQRRAAAVRELLATLPAVEVDVDVDVEVEAASEQS